MTRIEIFKASDAPICVILYRACKRKQHWLMLKWNLKTDTIIEGQWLLKKWLFLDACSISPDGTLFYWNYQTFSKKSDPVMTCVGISRVPNWTALMFVQGTFGRYQECRFDSVTKRPFDFETPLVAKTKSSKVLLSTNKDHPPCDSGRIKEREFYDALNQRTINFQDGSKIYADDKLLYDFTGKEFDVKSKD